MMVSQCVGWIDVCVGSCLQMSIAGGGATLYVSREWAVDVP